MVSTKVGSRYYEIVNEADENGDLQDYVVKYTSAFDDETDMTASEGVRMTRWLKSEFAAAAGTEYDGNTNENFEAIKTALGI